MSAGRIFSPFPFSIWGHYRAVFVFYFFLLQDKYCCLRENRRATFRISGTHFAPLQMTVHGQS